MPKIPNYTAKHDEAPGNQYRWEHDELESMVVEVVQRFPQSGEDPEVSEYWKVELWDHAFYQELGPISNNKEDMRREAVEWMREHPEGWEHEQI